MASFEIQVAKNNESDNTNVPFYIEVIQSGVTILASFSTQVVSSSSTPNRVGITSNFDQTLPTTINYYNLDTKANNIYISGATNTDFSTFTSGTAACAPGEKKSITFPAQPGTFGLYLKVTCNQTSELSSGVAYQATGKPINGLYPNVSSVKITDGTWVSIQTPNISTNPRYVPVATSSASAAGSIPAPIIRADTTNPDTAIFYEIFNSDPNFDGIKTVELYKDNTLLSTISFTDVIHIFGSLAAGTYKLRYSTDTTATKTYSVFSNEVTLGSQKSTIPTIDTPIPTNLDVNGYATIHLIGVSRSTIKVYRNGVFDQNTTIPTGTTVALSVTQAGTYTFSQIESSKLESDKSAGVTIGLYITTTPNCVTSGTFTLSNLVYNAGVLTYVHNATNFGTAAYKLKQGTSVLQNGNTGNPSEGGNPQINVGALTEGTYTLEVTGVSCVGIASANFTIAATTGPTIKITILNSSNDVGAIAPRIIRIRQAGKVVVEHYCTPDIINNPTSQNYTLATNIYEIEVINPNLFESKITPLFLFFNPNNNYVPEEVFTPKTNIYACQSARYTIDASVITNLTIGGRSEGTNKNNTQYSLVGTQLLTSGNDLDGNAIGSGNSIPSIITFKKISDNTISTLTIPNKKKWPSGIGGSILSVDASTYVPYIPVISGNQTISPPVIAPTDISIVQNNGGSYDIVSGSTITLGYTGLKPVGGTIQWYEKTISTGELSPRGSTNTFNATVASTTYGYVAKFVDSNGISSAYSNTVTFNLVSTTNTATPSITVVGGNTLRITLGSSAISRDFQVYFQPINVTAYTQLGVSYNSSALTYDFPNVDNGSYKVRVKEAALRYSDFSTAVTVNVVTQSTAPTINPFLPAQGATMTGTACTNASVDVYVFDPEVAATNGAVYGDGKADSKFGTVTANTAGEWSISINIYRTYKYFAYATCPSKSKSPKSLLYAVAPLTASVIPTIVNNVKVNSTIISGTTGTATTATNVEVYLGGFTSGDLLGTAIVVNNSWTVKRGLQFAEKTIIPVGSKIYVRQKESVDKEWSLFTEAITVGAFDSSLCNVKRISSHLYTDPTPLSTSYSGDLSLIADNECLAGCVPEFNLVANTSGGGSVSLKTNGTFIATWNGGVVTSLAFDYTIKCGTTTSSAATIEIYRADLCGNLHIRTPTKDFFLFPNTISEAIDDIGIRIGIIPETSRLNMTNFNVIASITGINNEAIELVNVTVDYPTKGEYLYFSIPKAKCPAIGTTINIFLKSIGKVTSDACLTQTTYVMSASPIVKQNSCIKIQSVQFIPATTHFKVSLSLL